MSFAVLSVIPPAPKVHPSSHSLIRTSRILTGVLLAVSTTLVGQTQTSTQTAYASLSPAKMVNRVALAKDYGNLPLSFEANQGQTDPRVKFVSRGNGYSLFLTDSSAVFSLSPIDQSESPGVRRHGVAVHMELAGANRSASIVGGDKLPGISNYFLGEDSSKWQSNIPTYSKVRYAGVYQGIDLIYYGNQRQLEYDFVVAPHADPAKIGLKFSGVQKLSVNQDGDLLVATEAGPLSFHKPLIYQDRNGRRQVVDGRFALFGDNTVGFSVGAYDHTQPLILDPVLVYSTYLGGTGSAHYGLGDIGNGIAVNTAGEVYVTGSTYSEDFPVTPGALETTGSPYVDQSGRANTSVAFVTKLNTAGTALLYSTYLGSKSSSIGNAITIDGGGNAYVTGTAFGSFPTTAGAFQLTYRHAVNSGGAAGFVSKLNSAGTALIYSTYLSGTGGADSANAIAVDSSGDAYVGGSTFSSDFPVTNGVIQTLNHGAAANAYNGFVTKLNSTGTGLIYSTFLGGANHAPPLSTSASAGDAVNSLVLDSTGDAFVAGITDSADFPITSGSFQTVNKNPHGFTVFAAKLNPTATALVYSTYLGGSGNPDLDTLTGYLTNYEVGDAANAIAVDSSGNAYIAGLAESTDFPVSQNAFQPTLHAYLDSNAFVTKLNPTGSSIVYSTYLGGISGSHQGAGDTYATGIAVDISGNVYVAGASGTADFPVTQGAFQEVNNNAGPFPNGTYPSGAYGPNAFISKLDPTGHGLLYSTYLGGSVGSIGYGDFANMLVIDSRRNVYLIGQAASTNFPVTVDAFQTLDHAVPGVFPTPEAFISKLNFEGTGTPLTLGTTTSLQADSPEKGMLAITVSGNGTNNIPSGRVVIFEGSLTSQIALVGGKATYKVANPQVLSQTLQVTYLGATGFARSSAILILTAGPSSPPTTITLVSGSQQTASINDEFPDYLEVKITDSKGNPVSGATVTFTAPKSGPSAGLLSNPTITPENGLAAVSARANGLVGGYPVTASVLGLSSTVSFSLTNTKGVAYVYLNSLNHVYTGQPQSAVGSTDYPTVGVSLTYNGSAQPPTATGSYTVVGTVSDPNYTGSATATFTISKATATITLGNLTQSYTGSPLSVSTATSPGGRNVIVTYNGSTTPPTTPGSYSVAATVTDPNYTGGATGTLTITPATRIMLGFLNQTYTGYPLGVTVSTNPSGLPVHITYNGSIQAPTAVGTYTVVATSMDPNYPATVTATKTISKGRVNIALGNLTQNFTGTPLSPTATTTPGGLPVTLTYNGSSIPPINAGNYTLIATVSQPSYAGTAIGTLKIKAPATISFGFLNQTYTGHPLGVTVSTNPGGLAVHLTYNGSINAPTAIGTYTVVGTINDASYFGTVTATKTISKATANIVLSNLIQNYTGSPLTGTATTVPAGVPVTLTYNGSITPPTKPGTYTVVGAAVSDTYTGKVTGTLTIKAPATITFGFLTQAYTGHPLGVSATTNPPGLAVHITYNGSIQAPTAVGTYTVVGTINDPNYFGTMTATKTILAQSQQ